MMTRIKRSRRNFTFVRALKQRAFRFPIVLTLCGLLVLVSSRYRSPLVVLDPQNQNSIVKQEKNHRWAYVFLLADVDPERPFYRGLLFNIMVSTYLLKYDSTSASKTKADIVVLVQMASSSQSSKLPEETFLQRMNVQVRYLPSIHGMSPTFYSLVLAKFQVLRLTEYSKILFLDGDVLPFCNLDYLLKLSEEGVLQETVLHAMYEDPVNAGLFVVTPKQEYYDQVQTIIQNHGMPGMPSKENNWNSSVGWGNESVDYRLWDMKQGRGWGFYCADADQGLLLYWARFLRRNLSIIVGPVIEQYSSSTTPTTISSNGLLAYSCLAPAPAMGRSKTFAQNAGPKAASLPVYQDFFHKVGYSKAWEMPPTRPVPTSKEQVKSSSEYWYFLLQQVKEQFDIENIIPPLNLLSASIPKPRVRGDLFTTVE
jgi:hypothetical protein